MLLKTILFLIFSNFILASTIQIAVSANVSYAMEELKKEFNRLYPEIKVKSSIGSSGKLTAQIENGAPFDIFLSANMKYPKKLYEDNFAITRPLVYAKGSLVLFSIKPRDLSQGVNLLTNSDIKKIAVANPKTAPYGTATVDALNKINIYNKIRDKIVFGENISATFNYALRATDVGIVAKSLLFAPKLKDRFKKGKNWIDLNSSIYEPIKQGVVILKHGYKNKDVSLFFSFLFSKDAQKIFREFGY
jgi:molybdate transport system substrate-binding protein